MLIETLLMVLEIGKNNLEELRLNTNYYLEKEFEVGRNMCMVLVSLLLVFYEFRQYYLGSLTERITSTTIKQKRQ